MKKLRNLLVLVLVVVFTFSLVACGGKAVTEPSETSSTETAATSAEPTSTTPAEKVTLDFGMIAWANEIPAWTAMLDAANKKLADKNIEIKISKVPAKDWSEYYTKIITQMAAGKAPDLGRVAESYMPQLINKGQVLDITDAYDQLDKSQYFEKAFQASSFKDGKYYGFPSGMYYMVMYYNKDMFAKAGLPEPSKDWKNATSFEQIREYAKKLTTGEGANKAYGFHAGPYMAFVGMYAKSNGGNNVFDASGNPTMNDTISKGVYKWFDDLLRVDKTMPTPTVTKVMSQADLFKAGRLAMIVDGSWDNGVFKTIDKFKVGIAAVPSGLGQSYATTFVDAFVAFKGTKHEKEAKEALKAIISKEGFDALSPTGYGGLPVVKETMQANLTKLVGAIYGEDDMKAYIEGLDNIIPCPYNDYYQEADSKINATIDEWMLSKVTSDQFADKVQDILVKTAADYAAKK
jgi:multiple sugar transport system substrate-binding protein